MPSTHFLMLIKALLATSAVIYTLCFGVLEENFHVTFTDRGTFVHNATDLGSNDVESFAHHPDAHFKRIEMPLLSSTR